MQQKQPSSYTKIGRTDGDGGGAGVGWGEGGPGSILIDDFLFVL